MLSVAGFVTLSARPTEHPASLARVTWRGHYLTTVTLIESGRIADKAGRGYRGAEVTAACVRTVVFSRDCKAPQSHTNGRDPGETRAIRKTPFPVRQTAIKVL